MTVAVLSLLAVLVAVTAARLSLEVHGRVRRPPAVDRHVGHVVVLHLRAGGPSLRGVLAETASDALTLAQAEHLGPQGDVVALDGRQIVPRERLDYFQVLDGGRA